MQDVPNLGAGDVLIVDDDPAIVELVVEVLTEEGYAVRNACDGLQALQAITEAPPALLLLDIQMPGMSGVELAMRVRAAGYGFPIVIITATPKLAEPLLTLERVECLAKPFVLEMLFDYAARYVPRASDVSAKQ
jgi:two-component system response regulator MprA